MQFCNDTRSLNFKMLYPQKRGQVQDSGRFWKTTWFMSFALEKKTWLVGEISKPLKIWKFSHVI